jgi:hypothetical protein
MRSDGFELEIFTPEKADVYVAYPAGGLVPWPIVRRLDQVRIRAVTDMRDAEPDEQRVRRIMTDCSALVAVLPYRPSEACTTDSALVGIARLGAEMGLPIAILREQGVHAVMHESANDLNLQFGDSVSIPVARGQIQGPILYSEQSGFSEAALPLFDRFLAEVLKDKARIRPYAFFVGRLERDFTHAREAIRVAVEAEAGIPCLWSDDGRHRINVESVRERTRMLIEHAAFVIADLTLGTESPERENPSRAHEIGMTIAYGRKLMLCSQEPRRYPYFSIGDMQMTFWSTEADLECKVREWIRTSRHSPARTVLNHGLADANTDTDPRIKKPGFTFDVNRRYVGPQTKSLPNVRAPIVALGAGAMCLAFVHLATLYFSLGSGAYWAVYIVLVFTVFVWPHLSGRARGVLEPAGLVAQFLVLAALTLMTLLLAATKAP